MIVRVDALGTVTLDEPGVVTRLEVAAAAGVDVGGALRAAGAGRPLDAGHVELAARWLRAQAAGHASPEALDGMLGYAASKGWLSADGTHVRAHLG